MVIILLFASVIGILYVHGRRARRHSKRGTDHAKPKRRGTPPGLAELIFLCAWISLWSCGILVALAMLILSSGQTVFVTLFLSVWLLAACIAWIRVADRIASAICALTAKRRH